MIRKVKILKKQIVNKFKKYMYNRLKHKKDSKELVYN